MHALTLGRAFARSSFLVMLAHRLRYLAGVLNYLVYIAVAWYLWEAVFFGQLQVAGWTLAQMQTYVCVNWITRATYFSNSDNILASRINKGEIVSDLLRPTSLFLQFYATALGEMIFRALFMSLPIGLLVAAIFRFQPPASAGHVLAFAVSALLAFHLFFAINFLTGLCAVFTEKLQGFLWAKFLLLQFLSGQLLPLEFFKAYPALYTVLDFLPFKGLAYTPMNIYLGRWDAAQIYSELSVQMGWTAGLLVLCELAWRAVRRRLSVLGG